MKAASLFLAFLLTFASMGSAQANYQISDDQWRFELILDTCGELLEEAITDLNLPEEAKITYPDTMGDKYVRIEIRVPNMKDVAILEFEYWVEDEDYLVCTGVSAVDYIY